MSGCCLMQGGTCQPEHHLISGIRFVHWGLPKNPTSWMLCCASSRACLPSCMQGNSRSRTCIQLHRHNAKKFFFVPAGAICKFCMGQDVAGRLAPVIPGGAGVSTAAGQPLEEPFLWDGQAALLSGFRSSSIIAKATTTNIRSRSSSTMSLSSVNVAARVVRAA